LVNPLVVAACLSLPYAGGPRHCVKKHFEAELEPGRKNVVALVEAPNRFDQKTRLRLFIYRLEGRRLLPRFLGSAFPGADLLDARGALRVVTTRGEFDCHFDGFPLVCEEAQP
jgi:hypothetical protein